MAFEDIKLRGLTFAERSELIKAELDPLYTLFRKKPLNRLNYCGIAI